MASCVVMVLAIFAIIPSGAAIGSCKLEPDKTCTTVTLILRQDCYCDDSCRGKGNCCYNFYYECKRGKAPNSRFGDTDPPDAVLAEKAERIGYSIMSEAAGEYPATKDEQIAIGYASQRNPEHATATAPTWEVQNIADDVASGSVADKTQGANRWYSPVKMPKEGQSCAAFDCGGGLEQTPGLTKKNYKPSWANESMYIWITGVRPARLKFYKLSTSSSVESSSSSPNSFLTSESSHSVSTFASTIPSPSAESTSTFSTSSISGQKSIAYTSESYSRPTSMASTSVSTTHPLWNQVHRRRLHHHHHLQQFPARH